MANRYQTFQATRDYHYAVSQLLWYVEQMILGNASTFDGWDVEYLTQCIHDVLAADRALQSTKG